MLEENRYWKQRVTRRRFLGAVGTGATAAALAAACGGGTSTSPTKPNTASGGQGAAPAKQLSATKAGGFIDRTGATANVGTNLGAGTNVWVEYANANNLAGRKVDWIEIDHSYQVDKAQAGYKKYVEQDKVAAILSYGTPITQALAPSADDDKVPLFTPGFGLSESEDGTKYPYVFVGAASYRSQAMALLGYVKDTWKDTSRKPKAIFLYYDNAAGQDPLDLIKAQAPKLNIDLLTTIAVPTTTTDMAQQLVDIKSKDPDFLICHLFGATPALSMKAAAQVGFPREKMYSFVWGGGEPDFEVAGPAAEGYYNLQFTAHPTDNPQAYQLLRDYWKKMGKTEDTKLTGSVFYARGVFNAALIMEGIKNSADKDKLTGEDVKKGMETLADFKVYGLSPGVTLSSSDHGGTRKLRLMQFKNGKNSLVKDWFEGPKPA